MTARVSLLHHLQRPVFWGSLMLNIALIAVLIIGPHRLLPFLPFPPPGPPPPGIMLKHMGQDLTGADKVIFDKALAKHLPALRKRGEQVLNEIYVIADVIQADSFDINALKEKHLRLDHAKGNMDTVVADFISEIAVSLSPDGRKHLKLRPPRR